MIEYLELYVERVSINKYAYITIYPMITLINIQMILLMLKTFNLNKIPEKQIRKATLHLITFPKSATLDGYHLKATIGDTVSFQGDINASNLRECTANAGENATYKLWYMVDNQKAVYSSKF